MSTAKEDLEFLKLVGIHISLKKGSGEYKENFQRLMNAWLKIDRSRIREYLESEYVEAMKDFLLMKWDPFQMLEDEQKLQNLAEHHEIDWIASLKRYFKLQPPYVKAGRKIPKGIADLYRESRFCYVHGQYSAAIVLSRAIIETVLKNKFMLRDKKKKWKAGETLWKLHDKGLISNRSHSTGIIVVEMANLILHKAKLEKEKRAKKAIDYTKVFLEEIYSK